VLCSTSARQGAAIDLLFVNELGWVAACDACARARGGEAAAPFVARVPAPAAPFAVVRPVRMAMPGTSIERGVAA
jgi:biotin synthase-related radical SAM superfamily protein